MLLQPPVRDDAGDLVFLEQQGRLRWDQKQIAEASLLVEQAFAVIGPG